MQLKKELISNIASNYETWPDIIKIGEKLFCAYSETTEKEDFSETTIVCCQSTDYGISWNKTILPCIKRRVPFWYRVKFLKNYPSEIIVFCVLAEKSDGYGELAYFKSADGCNWSEPFWTGIYGILSGSPIVTQKGRIIIPLHKKNEITGYFEQSIYYSDDLVNWKKAKTVIKQHGYNFGDSEIIEFDEKLILLVREKSPEGWDLFISFSEDDGISWSSPQKIPFKGGQNPSAGIVENKVFITFAKDSLKDCKKSVLFTFADVTILLKNHRKADFNSYYAEDFGDTFSQSSLGLTGWALSNDLIFAVEYCRSPNQEGRINAIIFEKNL